MNQRTGKTSEPGPPLQGLRRRVEGLLDTDALLPADGRALLDMLDAAERCFQAEDPSTARGLLQGFVALLEALTEGGILDPADGGAALQSARRLLAAPAG